MPSSRNRPKIWRIPAIPALSTLMIGEVANVGWQGFTLNKAAREKCEFAIIPEAKLVGVFEQGRGDFKRVEGIQNG